MLRRRAKPSGGGGTKQHKVAFEFDHGGGVGVISPPFASPPPKLLLASSPERTEQAVMMSPTSILQTAEASPTSPAAAVPFSRTGSGVSGERRSKSHRPWDAKPVGLGLVGALNREAPDDVACASTVLTGQKLRVQTNHAPCSPPSKEFGVKSRTGDAGSPTDPRRCLSPREMEMSEYYTRVIARGPNPRTTHIFDSRGGFGFSPEHATAASGGRDDDFLRHCHGCSKDLSQGKDIFMYRGERAFCSRECRYREMLLDNGTEEF